MSCDIEDIRTGTSVATMTSTGSLGVGTSDPSVIIDVVGDTSLSGNVFFQRLKSGASQGAAGARANELWIDTNDNTIKIGT